MLQNHFYLSQEEEANKNYTYESSILQSHFF
jgi:hypothetical protein